MIDLSVGQPLSDIVRNEDSSGTTFVGGTGGAETEDDGAGETPPPEDDGGMEGTPVPDAPQEENVEEPAVPEAPQEDDQGPVEEPQEEEQPAPQGRLPRSSKPWALSTALVVLGRSGSIARLAVLGPAQALVPGFCSEVQHSPYACTLGEQRGLPQMSVLPGKGLLVR